MHVRAVLARNLKRYRRTRNLSQEELAHQAGIDRTYISAPERCVYDASVDVLARIAAVLGVTPAALLAEPGDPPEQAGKPGPQSDGKPH